MSRWMEGKGSPDSTLAIATKINPNWKVPHIPPSSPSNISVMPREEANIHKGYILKKVSVHCHASVLEWGKVYLPGTQVVGQKAARTCGVRAKDF